MTYREEAFYVPELFAAEYQAAKAFFKEKHGTYSRYFVKAIIAQYRREKRG